MASGQCPAVCAIAATACFARTGSFCLEAAEAVTSGDGNSDADAFNGIDSLLTKSLLRQEDQASDRRRFGLLETIREFALGLLPETEETKAKNRHLANEPRR